MRNFLVENIGGDVMKGKYRVISIEGLLGGFWGEDNDFVEVGEIVKTHQYEENLRVLDIETGERYVEVTGGEELDESSKRYMLYENNKYIYKQQPGS